MTMMAGVCLLALVLTFTIAECGLPQKNGQTPSCEEVLQTCMTTCQQAADAGGSDAVLPQCKESCNTAHDACSRTNGGNVPDGGNGSNDDDSDNDEDSGATAIAEATIFSTISALVVAVASAMN